ncbi:PepSY-associated TM helix domain-containing protein [Pelagibius sp. 7325]|uniref:PepSY-associated TM helix domain-containing protein n=1 Tax=Pelagibius sp. 7325 TaxID=3131994 RepID=UPI0030EC0357
MKGAFRPSMSWLHTWAGLVVGWVLFFIFLTGTAGYFDAEIDRWMQPERPLIEQKASAPQEADGARRFLERQAGNAERWLIVLSGDRLPDVRLFWRNPPTAAGAAAGEEYLEPATGNPVSYRKTGGGQLLYKMHYRLHYLPEVAAYWLVGLCTMAMLVGIVTGVIVHKRIFRDFFTLRLAKGQRSWLDAHNGLSVLALPFHLMITYSGLMFLVSFYMAPVVVASYGLEGAGRGVYFDELFERGTGVARSGEAAPLAPLGPMVAEAEHRMGVGAVSFIDVSHPGDTNARVAVTGGAPHPTRRDQRLLFDGVSGRLLSESGPRSAPLVVFESLLGLHEGLFAGPVLRWLYFLSGAMGTAMIAAGLILWTVKRRARAGDTTGFRLVECLNIGTLAGLPIALAAYFWANRLIPVGIDDRAAWEGHSLFLTWAVLLIHPFLRPAARAWREQLWLAAAAFALLPAVNALTTARHLGITLPAGIWDLAGIDLAFLTTGLAFAAAALAVTPHTGSARAPRRRPAE